MQLFSQEPKKRYALCDYFIALLGVCKPRQVSLLLLKYFQFSDRFTQLLGLSSSICSISLEPEASGIGFGSKVRVCIHPSSLHPLMAKDID